MDDWKKVGAFEEQLRDVVMKSLGIFWPHIVSTFLPLEEMSTSRVCNLSWAQVIL